MATKAEVEYIGMRWGDAAKFSEKARELREMAAWIENYSNLDESTKNAMNVEADRLDTVAFTIRAQCESLAGWEDWSKANTLPENFFDDWCEPQASSLFEKQIQPSKPIKEAS
jgi:hypothetical protein